MANYKSENMLEKHYTPQLLQEDMWELLNKHYTGEITEFLENSAGDGRLIDFLKSKSSVPVLAFDIKNETNRNDIIETDYSKEKIDYKKGRVAFINPPFNKGLSFVYKALEECDYVISVLSVNSIINLDYDKYDVDAIDVYRRFDFGSCVTNICVMAIKKK